MRTRSLSDWILRFPFRWGTVLMVLTLLTTQSSTAHAGSPALAKTKLIWPSFGIAFPTGRFGKTDTDATPPKTGQKNGWAPAFEAGYFITESFAIGLSADLARFKIDYGKLPAPKSAHTTVISGSLYARLFLPGGYQHWRPYVLVGVGLGRPKASIEYSPPMTLQVADSTILVTKAESRVQTSLSLTGALGVLLPASPTFCFSVESRYRSLSTKGVNRTDGFTTPEGLSIESEMGTDSAGRPVRLKCKSNTTWWELRAGLILTVR